MYILFICEKNVVHALRCNHFEIQEFTLNDFLFHYNNNLCMNVRASGFDDNHDSRKILG